MNDFYYISEKKSNPDDALQLNNLGDKIPLITIGGGSGDYTSHYRTTTSADYDKQFANRIQKTNPAYDVENLLDYHFEHYIKRFPESSKTFLKHIQFVIIPIIEKKKKDSVYIELIREWLSEKKNLLLKPVEKPAISIQSEALTFNSLPVKDSVEQNDGEVFISYSWDSLAHEKKVLEFTDYLRKKGFNAHVDKMITQQETAINFVRMMHTAMQIHPKVIIVLSSGYKRKAELFTGGVGEEYQLLLNDIKESPRKYILVSFDGRSEEIVPFGLRGRDIIDLSKLVGEEQLFRKLMDQPTYQFSDVGSQKPDLKPNLISEFNLNEMVPQIRIERVEIKPTGNSSLSAGLYKNIEFDFFAIFKNVSSKPVDGFAYQFKCPKSLLQDYRKYDVVDNLTIYNGTISQKMFPSQSISSVNFKLLVTNNNVRDIIDSKIVISIYSENDAFNQDYSIKDLIKLRPSAQPYYEEVPISVDLFYL